MKSRKETDDENTIRKMSENMYQAPHKLFHLAKTSQINPFVLASLLIRKKERIPDREDVITICIHEALGAVLAGSKMQANVVQRKPDSFDARRSHPGTELSRAILNPCDFRVYMSGKTGRKSSIVGNDGIRSSRVREWCRIDPNRRRIVAKRSRSLWTNPQEQKGKWYRNPTRTPVYGILTEPYTEGTRKSRGGWYE